MDGFLLTAYNFINFQGRGVDGYFYRDALTMLSLCHHCVLQKMFHNLSKFLSMRYLGGVRLSAEPGEGAACSTGEGPACSTGERAACSTE